MAVDLTERVVFFEKHISETRTSIRFAWILAFAVFVTGVVCAVAIYSLSSEEGYTKLVGTVGSGLVTLLSAVPLKDYFGQRSTIITFEYIKSRYEKLNSDPKGKNDPELEKLETIFYTLVVKPIGA
jgi:hypothetical protein